MGFIQKPHLNVIFLKETHSNILTPRIFFFRNPMLIPKILYLYDIWVAMQNIKIVNLIVKF